jgi:hypothetical protein
MKKTTTMDVSTATELHGNIFVQALQNIWSCRRRRITRRTSQIKPLPDPIPSRATIQTPSLCQ